METVDLKLVLLGAHRSLPKPVNSNPQVASRLFSHSPAARILSALSGQPGVGKTCLVYRYLYNTFGETISVRATRDAHTLCDHYRASARHAHGLPNSEC